MDAHQSCRRVAEQLGEALHPLVNPSCYTVHVAGLEVPLAGPGEETVPGLDDGNTRAPESSHPDIEAGELVVVGRHAAV